MNTTTRTAAHAIAANLTFGVEIETYGLGDHRAAMASLRPPVAP